MFTIIKANIRHQKSGFIGVFVLILIITISLCTVLTIWKNSSEYESNELNRIKYGDISTTIYENPDMDKVDYSFIGELAEKIRQKDYVKSVGEQQIIHTSYDVAGKESSNWGFVSVYNKKQCDYHFFKSGLTEFADDSIEIKSGEIYVPTSFCSLYDANIGDKVDIVLNDSNTITFKIAGFFEDPVMGSSMMGIKNMLVNQDDFTAAWNKTTPKIKGCAKIGEMLHIFKNPDMNLSNVQLQTKLNRDVNLSKYSIFTYEKSAIKNFMLILQNIFAGFLFVFVLLLLVVAMIVLGHSISSSIEQDYVNMGIYKATGYTCNSLRMMQLCEYLIAIVGSMLIGFPMSMLLVKIVNSITVKITGILIPSDIPCEMCLIFLLTILALLILFIILKTIKIKKITPIKAIRNGADDVYFKSRVTAPVYQKGLCFWMAFRQLTFEKKQYISAGIVTMLLVFFLSFVGRIGAWMGPNGEGLMHSFGNSDYDIGLYITDENDSGNILTEAKKKIEEYSEIEAQFKMKTVTGALNDQDYVMNIISDSNEYNIIHGRTCRYSNEIVITETAANVFKLHIGDDARVSYMGNSKKYIVSGIYQCANDLGANFGISSKGFERLGKDKGNYYNLMRLCDTTKKKSIVKDLKKTFGDKIEIDENTWSGLDGILSAFDALFVLMYIIVIIFITVVIILTGSKILYKEKKDMGIYKSLGFSSAKLRIMFALRFGIVAAVGSLFGIIISAAVTDKLTGRLLVDCGISEFSSKLNIVQAVWPAIFVVLMFIAFAYVAARKVKRINPVILIAE